MPLRCCIQYVSKSGRPSSSHRTGKAQSSSQFSRMVAPKNVLIIEQLHSSPMLVRSCLKSCKLGFSIMWTKKVQMSKPGLTMWGPQLCSKAELVCCPLCSSLCGKEACLFMCLSCLSLTFKKKGKCISFAELGLSRHTLDLQAALRHVGIFFVCFLSPLLGRREWSLSIWCSPRSVAPGTVLSTSKL